MNKVIVGRHEEGITLNDLEYLLEEPEGDYLKFDSLADAKDFLASKGYTEENLYWLRFKLVDENGKIVGDAEDENL